MADVSTKIIIRGDADAAITALQKVSDRLKDLVGFSSAADTAMKILGSSWVASKFFSGFMEGVNAVDEFQQSIAKTSALITSLQGGSDVASDYAKAKEYAFGLQEVLQQVDARTTLNLSNLQTITEEMAKQGVLLDYNNSAQVNAFTALANAGAVYSENGKKETQLRQEIAALLRGEVNMNSQLASMIQRQVDGPLAKYVEKWKQSGTLLEELAKYMKGFDPASKDIAATWSAVKSSLETAINVILRAGFSNIVKDISDKLNQINEYLKSHKQELADIISNGWDKFKSAVSFLLDTMRLLQPVLSVVMGSMDLIAVALGTIVAVNIVNGIAALVTQFNALKIAAVAASEAMAIGGLASLGTGGTIGLAAGLTALTVYAGKKIGDFAGQYVYGDQIAAEEARGKAADQKSAEIMKRIAAKNSVVPKIDLKPTQDQIKEQEKLADLRLKIQETVDKTELQRLKDSAKIKADILKEQWDRGQVSMQDYYSASIKTAQDTLKKELNILDKRKSQIQESYGKAKEDDRKLQLQNELKQVEGQREQLLSQYGQSQLNRYQQFQSYEQKAIELTRQHTEAAEEQRQKFESMTNAFPQMTGYLNEITSKQLSINALTNDMTIARGRGQTAIVNSIQNEIGWIQKQIDKTRELATEELKSIAFKTGNYALIAEAELADKQGNKQLADALKAQVAAKNELMRINDEIKKGTTEYDTAVTTLQGSLSESNDQEIEYWTTIRDRAREGIQFYQQLLELQRQAVQQSVFDTADVRMGLSKADNYSYTGTSVPTGGYNSQTSTTSAWAANEKSSVTINGGMTINVPAGGTADQTGNNIGIAAFRAITDTVANSM